MVLITVSFTDTGVTPPVFVAGSFTDWQPIELDHTDVSTENGTKYLYKKDFNVAAGDHQYKLRLGSGDWWVCDAAVSRAYDAAGNENNVLVVEPPIEGSDAAHSNDTSTAHLVTTSAKDATPPATDGTPDVDQKDKSEDDRAVHQNTIDFNTQSSSVMNSVKANITAAIDRVQDTKQDKHNDENAHDSEISNVVPTSHGATNGSIQKSSDQKDEHDLTTHTEEKGFVSINKPSVALNDACDTATSSSEETNGTVSHQSKDSLPKVDMSAWKSADKPLPAKSAMKQSEAAAASGPESEPEKQSFIYRLCCSSRNVVVAAFIVGLPVYLSWRWSK